MHTWTAQRRRLHWGRVRGEFLPACPLCFVRLEKDKLMAAIQSMPPSRRKPTISRLLPSGHVQEQTHLNIHYISNLASSVAKTDGSIPARQPRRNPRHHYQALDLKSVETAPSPSAVDVVPVFRDKCRTPIFLVPAGKRLLVLGPWDREIVRLTRTEDIYPRCQVRSSSPTRLSCSTDFCLRSCSEVG